MLNSLSRLSDCPQPAKLLGVAGLLPFVASAGALWWFDGALWQVAQTALLVYGAVILSFLGGVRWGVALRTADGDWIPWLLSVAPSVWAWFAVLLGGAAGLLLLVIGFVAQWRYDLRAVASEALPAWFGPLRSLLTAGATASLAVGAVALWV
ncbi:MAG: DUF3429 domain-containing protein [Pseudomonadota bacterium]